MECAELEELSYAMSAIVPVATVPAVGAYGASYVPTAGASAGRAHEFGKKGGRELRIFCQGRSEEACVATIGGGCWREDVCGSREALVGVGFGRRLG